MLREGGTPVSRTGNLELVAGFLDRRRIGDAAARKRPLPRSNRVAGPNSQRKRRRDRVVGSPDFLNKRFDGVYVNAEQENPYQRR